MRLGTSLPDDPSPAVRTKRRLAGASLLAGVSLAAMLIAGQPAAAQEDARDGALGDLLAAEAAAGDQRMVLEADTLVYDIDTEQVAAVGNVVIYYGEYVLVAERVEVDRRTQMVTAIGSVEVTEPGGNIVRSERVELADDLSRGVIEAFEVVTSQRTAFRSARATREGDDVTTFEDSTYLPCVDCDGVKGKEPIWRIRARQIIHKQGEKTVTLRDASFEFLGVPIAWVPVLTQPDPTVRRKTGFLAPTPVYNDDLGFGLVVPYFWALAPNMDLTFRPAVYSRQGFLADAEFRHRLIDGAYSIRVAGIHQSSPDAFEGTSGDVQNRAALFSTGEFQINQRWKWGWDIAVASDRSFLDDYDLPKASNDAAISDLYLIGAGDRSRFEAHAYGIMLQQEDETFSGVALQPQDVDLQDKQPFIHPVVDYYKVLDQQIAGGEVKLEGNFTSLTRQEDDIFAFGAGDERFRGVGGTFTRASADVSWRRRFVDPLGQVFTPFAGVSGDVFFSSLADDSTASLEEGAFGRVMPRIGLEYSYPILAQSSLGTQVFEPIAQLVVRPDEMLLGEVPNEDSQSLVFDETSLFDIDKFSGFDREEGGTRLNVGLRNTTNLAVGGSISALIGQSFHLAGRNSYAADNVYGTGLDSGLSSDRSDYVAGLTVATTQGLQFGARARFDDEDFTVQRAEAQILGLSGPLTASLTYAFLREQPELGITNNRSELQSAISLRLDANWRIFGSTRFDIINENFVRDAVGIAYDDEAFSVSLSYAEDRTRANGEPIDRTVFLQLGFRTLGEVSTSADVLD